MKRKPSVRSAIWRYCLICASTCSYYGACPQKDCPLWPYRPRELQGKKREPDLHLGIATTDEVMAEGLNWCDGRPQMPKSRLKFL